MENKLISIIIPCYNSERYIDKTLMSLINQTSNNFEAIFIDDGSTDNTIEKIYEFFKDRDIDYKIIRQTNQGVSVARNIGIANSRGEYILFLDSDDLISNEACQIIEKEDKKNIFEMIIFNYIKDNHFRVIKYENIQYGYLDSYEVLMLYLKERLRYHICSIVVNRNVLIKNNIGFTKGLRYGEDHEFVVKCICSVKKVILKEDSVFRYIQREGSVINVFNLNRADSIKAAINIEKYITNLHNDYQIINLAKKKVAKTIINNINMMMECLNLSNIKDKEIKNQMMSIYEKNLFYFNYIYYGEKNNIINKLRLRFFKNLKLYSEITRIKMLIKRLIKEILIKVNKLKR